ncbi:unnamed protein product [Closterium sp. NIES-53]
MTLRPSTAPQRVPLPSPPTSSLPDGPDPESDSLRAASPNVTRFLSIVVIDTSFDSTTVFALVAELVDIGAACRLNYATSLIAESETASVCPLSVRLLAAALPHLVSMLLAPEGDPDAPDIPTPRSYAEAIEGPYSSQWQTAMDTEMASWKSAGTYVDEVPPPGANIVSGMWIFRMKRPPGSPPVFKARYWHDTLRTTLAALGFAPSTADPSLFLRTDTTLPPFYVLVYVDDLIFATADTEALAHVKSELQKRHTCTDLAPPSNESVELSGPYPELVGCLIHRKEHMDAAKRVLRYLCTTSGMGLVLGGRARVVLTGHADASWVDDLATQRSSQGYTFSLGSGSFSWRSTRSSSVLSSSCEAEIYAGAMAAQELRWLTYLLTNLGEPPRSPLVLYVDNKAMIALCQEHGLEQRTKHIALRYFLARELQQRGQLHLAYVATRANTADVFTKALPPCDHQPFFAFLDWQSKAARDQQDSTQAGRRASTSEARMAGRGGSCLVKSGAQLGQGRAAASRAAHSRAGSSRAARAGRCGQRCGCQQGGARAAWRRPAGRAAAGWREQQGGAQQGGAGSRAAQRGQGRATRRQQCGAQAAGRRDGQQGDASDRAATR